MRLIFDTDRLCREQTVPRGTRARLHVDGEIPDGLVPPERRLELGMIDRVRRDPEIEHRCALTVAPLATEQAFEFLVEAERAPFHVQDGHGVGARAKYRRE